MRKILASALALVSLLSLVHLGRATLPGLRGPDVVASQVSWLAGKAPSAASEMQALFPEGEFFTWALTGLAAGNLARAGRDPQSHLALLERVIAETGNPVVAGHFGTNDLLPHGTFYHGWRLLLLVDRAALTGDAAQLAEVSSEARAIAGALDENPLPSSYPGAAWPCDVIVALAAVHRASRIVEIPGLAGVTKRWFEAMEAYRDPSNGLLVHQRGESRARGASQSIIQVFLPDIDPERATREWGIYSHRHGLRRLRIRATREWGIYKQAFLSPTLGLVGIREHAHGVDAPGDVDSGPLVNGVSASASAVTLAAARRHGDIELATVLDREADLLGLPLPAGSGTTFALGFLPVGDAFVAWARSVPAGEATGDPAPQPWWWLMWLTALLPGAAGGALWFGRRRSRGKPPLP